MILDDISHIVIQDFFLFQCLDPLCGYDCSLQAGKGTQVRHSHTTLIIHMWDSHFIVEVQN